MKSFDDFIAATDNQAAIEGTAALMDRIMGDTEIPDELFDLFATYTTAQMAANARFVKNYLRLYHEWMQDQ